MAEYKKFAYTGTDANGKKLSGIEKGATREEVALILQKKGLFVESIKEELGLSLQSLSEIQIGGISLKERMTMIKQLSTMLAAGLPILQSLEILSKQLTNKSLREQLEQVNIDIESGASLSQAFAKNTTIFSEVQINLLIAGEKSGNLVEVISQISVDMEKSNELQSKIKSAMIYPAIVFIVIVIVMIVLIVFMIPTVENLYRDFNALDKIPGITKFMIDASKFFTNPVGMILLLLIIVTLVISLRSYNNTENGKLVIHKLLLKTPVFGNLIQKMQLAQFGRLMSMLMHSGVSIIDALKIVSNSSTNMVYKKGIYDTIEQVTKGVPLSVPLASSGIFPLIYTRMVSTGEQTGNMDKVLGDMGKFYEAEVNEITGNLTKLMEPLILLVVGGMVGFIAVAVYLPIYSIGAVIS